MCVCVCVRLCVRVVKHMSCMCGLCVCVWTHATVSVLMLPQSETSQAIPQKPQYCLVNTGTHTHTCKWHTHRHTVTPCSPVNSLQCFLSLLCRHKPKRQCCVQLIPLFRLRWQSRDRVRPDGATVVCARAWLLLSPRLRTHLSPPSPPDPALTHLQVCLRCDSPSARLFGLFSRRPPSLIGVERGHVDNLTVGAQKKKKKKCVQTLCGSWPHSV